MKNIFTLLFVCVCMMNTQALQSQPLTPCEELADDFTLSLQFSSPRRPLENCSVITGTVTATYPIDQVGTFTVCADLVTQAISRGYFEIFDNGDFTQSTTSNDRTQLCRELSFPHNLDEDGEPQGFYTLDFYAVPILVPSIPQTVANIGDLKASLTVNGVTSNCGTKQTYTFRGVQESDLSPGVVYNIPNGATLTSLYSDCDRNNCFRNPSTYNGPTDAKLIVNGLLEIDDDYRIGRPNDNELSSLTLGPDSRIIVKSGYTLEILSTEINGCREMWEAIVVEDGGTLVIRGSSIIGGEEAIRVMDGGTLMVDRSTFLNNHVSITVPPSDNNSRFPTQEPVISVFGSLFDFEVRDEADEVDDFFRPKPFLLPPYFGDAPRAAGEFSDVRSGILFSNSPGNNTRINERNLLQNLENGLIFNRSSGTVEGTEFRDMISTPERLSGNGVYSEGTGLRDRTSQNVNIWNYDQLDNKRVNFFNMVNAVHVVEASRTRVHNTLMEEVEIGLKAEAASDVFFLGNTVSSTRAGVQINGHGMFSFISIKDNVFDAMNDDNIASAIELNDPASPGFRNVRNIIRGNAIQLNGAQYGMRATNAQRTTIQNNIASWTGPMYSTFAFQLEGGSRPVLRGNGVIGNVGDDFTETFGFSQLQVDRPLLNCNGTRDVEKGLFFLGSNEGTRLEKNLMQNGGIGLQLGIPQVDISTVISPQVHGANRWLGNFNGFEAAYFNSTTLLREESQLIVDGSFGNQYVPSSLNSGVSDWVRFRTGDPSDYTPCPTGLPPIGLAPPTTRDSLTSAVIDETFEDQFKRGASLWLADVRTYRAEQYGELDATLYPNWNNWLAGSDRKEVISFTEVNNKIVAFEESRAYEKTNLDSIGNIIDSIAVAYSELTSDYYFDDTVNQNTVQTNRESALGQLSTTSDFLDSFSIASEPIRLNKLATAYQENDLLSTPNTHHSNQYLTNKYYLQWMEGGVTELLDNEPTILSIANQCPADGGEAVYQARAMANILGNSPEYDDTALCSSAKSLKPTIKLAVNNKGLQIYPNPTADYISINSLEKDIAQVSMLDVSGKLILRKYFKNGAPSLNLNVSDHKPGFYAVRITFTDGTSADEKVVVQ